MVKLIKKYQGTLLFLVDLLYQSNISEGLRMEMLKQYKAMNESLENEKQFYLAARKCKNHIERNGNKITITVPNVKKRDVTKNNVAAYRFMLGLENRYKTIKK